MSDNASVSFLCHSQQGINNASNGDYISAFEYEEGVLILLIDIATASPLDEVKFVGSLNKLVQQSVTTETIKSSDIFLSTFEQIVAALKEVFKIGCASLITAYVSKNSTSVWGYTIGDTRIGKLGGDDIAWLTNVHTGANPLGEFFTEEMKSAPERHLLTRSLNMQRPFNPDYYKIDLSDKQSLVIASDGFWADLSVHQQQLLLSQRRVATNDDCSFVKISKPFNQIKFCTTSQTKNAVYFIVS
jgi:serine/threonine protein phosphatase PrpC